MTLYPMFELTVRLERCQEKSVSQMMVCGDLVFSTRIVLPQSCVGLRLKHSEAKLGCAANYAARRTPELPGWGTEQIRRASESWFRRSLGNM